MPRKKWKSAHITLDGIPITVTRKNIKRMYLRIAAQDGAVRISAPLFVGEKEIYEFACSRLSWIREKRAACLFKQRETPARYESGERCLVWGKVCTLLIEEKETGAAQVCLRDKTLFLRIKAGSGVLQRKAALDAWYRESLRRAAEDIRERCEKIVGERAAEYRIRDMHTRWGSCNIGKRRIWLSLELAKKDPDCLEYVMIHELTHLLEKNHNARFYALMDRFYPGWRAVRARLNG